MAPDRSTATAVPSVRAIGDLPFRERPILELLALDRERPLTAESTLDTDYTGFGWARTDQLWLADPTSVRRIDDVLVLALHSADDGEAFPDDVELEFVLDAGEPDRSVTALLTSFLERWLPRLPTASTIVLAMCNPHRAQLRPPPTAGATPVFHAQGDCDAWLDLIAGGDRIRLVADGWRRAED